MESFKELRIVLDKKTHSAFKAAVNENGKSIKQTLIDLIERYIKEGN